MKKISLQLLLSAYRIYFTLLFQLQPRLGARIAFNRFATPFTKKLRAKERVMLGKARKETYQYNGIPIRTYTWGSGTKTALLVHGWEANGGSLGAFVEPLTEKGYKVISFDGPAHGNSGGKQTNLIHFGDLVAELIRMHTPDTLITHSFGSGSSIYALYRNQDLHIRKMIMLTTPDRMEDIFSEFTRIMKINQEGKESIYDHLYSLFGIRVEDMTVSGTAAECNISELLIIHSPSDRILPFRNAQKVAAGFPNAILEAPKNMGHYKILWHPSTIESVNKFIHA